MGIDMVYKCILCSVGITEENDTAEHIIPNAIGGRKKVRGFICNSCNNTSGNTWEKVLAKQLNPLSLFFRISRERGVAPSQVFETTSGDSIILKHNGSMALPKPIFSEAISNHNVKVNIQARDIKEVKKILKGVNRKYPKVNTETLLEQATFQSSYCSDLIKFELNFGGHESGRSIIKSALAVIIDAGKSASPCLLAIDYLTNESAEACFGYYYENDLVKNRPKGVPLHCISIKAEKTSGLILFYGEYFGVQRVVGCLADKYNGESFTHTYAINPVSGSELELSVDINLSLSEIRAAYNYEKIPNGAIEATISSIIPEHLEKHKKQERNRVIDKALLQAFEILGLKEGDQILPEHASQIASTITDEILPLLIHQSEIKKR